MSDFDSAKAAFASRLRLHAMAGARPSAVTILWPDGSPTERQRMGTELAREFRHKVRVIADEAEASEKERQALTSYRDRDGLPLWLDKSADTFAATIFKAIIAGDMNHLGQMEAFACALAFSAVNLDLSDDAQRAAWLAGAQRAGEWLDTLDEDEIDAKIADVEESNLAAALAAAEPMGTA